MTFSLALLTGFSLQAQVVSDVSPEDSQEGKIDPNAVVADPRAKILEEALENAGEPSRISVVVDSSGSMGQILDKNKTKMFYLKELMKTFMKFQWKEKNDIALRAYGGTPKSGCDDSRLAVKFGEKNLAKMEKEIFGFEPGGKTPLHKTLQESINDVKNYSGPKRVVIITDGEDTCGGDPCKTVEETNKENLDIKFYVVALGMKGSSDTLRKMKCMGDMHVANDGESFSEAMNQISKKISSRDNLQVISPNPNAVVYLYKVLDDGKRIIHKTFYASSAQAVEPGKYEVIVGLNPLYKFQEITVPPKKKVVLRVDGTGNGLVNYFNGLVNVELLNKDNKVVTRFKSDAKTSLPIGKWRLRMFKDPFYEQVLPDFFVYPNGEHNFDVSGVGVVRVDSPKMIGVYVYDQQNVLAGKFLTGFPMLLRTGVYTIHVNEKCSFPKTVVSDKKEINVLTCP